MSFYYAIDNLSDICSVCRSIPMKLPNFLHPSQVFQLFTFMNVHLFTSVLLDLEFCNLGCRYLDHIHLCVFILMYINLVMLLYIML